MWDELGRECRVAVAQFVLADQDWIKQGREWASIEDPQQHSRRVLMGVTGSTDYKLKIGRWDEQQKMVVELFDQVELKLLQPKDKQWAFRHIKSVRSQRPQTTASQDFAPYRR